MEIQVVGMDAQAHALSKQQTMAAIILKELILIALNYVETALIIQEDSSNVMTETIQMEMDVGRIHKMKNVRQIPDIFVTTDQANQTFVTKSVEMER